MQHSRLSPSVLMILALPSSLALAQSTPDQVVIHAETHVVLVNVVAKDNHGKPVSDLNRGDFVLRDNGQEQKIGLFALERADETPTGASTSAAQLTFTNRPSVAGVTVFLFDQLNTQLTDQELAKKDFVHYLRELPSASRVAVFALGDSLSLLHDCTEDQASLLDALSKHANRVNPELTAATAPAASANSLAGDPSTDAKWDSLMRSSNQAYVDYTETVRATRTAAALEIIAGHLQGIPGRKTLIWISGGFPIQLGLHNRVDTIPDGNSTARQSGSSRRDRGGRTADSARKSPSDKGSNASTPDNSSGGLPGTGTSFESDVERAIRALNEADVAVYPVNARGLTVAGPYQADRSSIGKRGQSMSGRSSGKRVKQGGAIPATDFDDETLQMLADETGGQAFHYINDLSSAIKDAADDARVSYSLTFSPPADSLDGSYHRIEVNVKRSDLKLRYRPGYVARRDAAIAPSLTDAIANPIDLAGIGFTVHLDKVEGGYKASAVIDPRNITLQPKDGKWIGSLQFLAVVGKLEQLMNIPLNFTEAVFHQIQDQGLHFSARVKTPPGATGFSLGFRDVPSGMVGTLHVSL
jgi:VWFA-related protein